MTRGEMAAFLVRALDLTASGPSFTDTNGHVFEQDISKLGEAGITRGCNPPDNTRFCPDDSVTRGEMAAFLVRALDLTASGPSFEDTGGHVFEKDISKLAEAGITRGCNPPENTRFCPDDVVTRAAMAAFLRRALETNPEGTGLIAFGTGTDIYVVKEDGSGLRNLTKVPDMSYNSEVEWSPDGSRLVFVSDRDGNPDVFVMNADGSDVTNLTPNTPGHAEFPTWSPDGKRIAFIDWVGGEDQSLMIVNDDGTGLANLTTIGKKRVGSPDFLADGSKIVFEYGNTVSAISPDGTGLELIKDGAGDEIRPRVAASPDGGLVGMTEMMQDGQDSAWLMPYPGDDARWGEIQPGSRANYFEAFTPDGDRLVYISRNPGPDSYPNLYMINTAQAATGNPVRLTDTTVHEDGVVFSPDGKKIVYKRSWWSGDDVGRSELVVMDLSSRKVVKVSPDRIMGVSAPDWQRAD
ncbi:MAG: hypothetical protein GEU79_03575 [Acidimicrobiia bacterium]|nr:hypothetical protein [Acidimicrobiia bacterium]